MPSKRELGERIKRLRLDRNLTLKDIEAKAKVSATHVSEIERGMTSPTVGALAKIARALDTEASYFLRSDTSPRVALVRKSERRLLGFESWGARIGCLSSGIGTPRLSFLMVELDPRPGQNVERITHTGEELIHVLKGIVEIHIDPERHLLKEGDSIHFRSQEPHLIRNIGDSPARLVWVTSPPFCL
jgi:transcriptional regulator with XRE-family HTH domain